MTTPIFTGHLENRLENGVEGGPSGLPDDFAHIVQVCYLAHLMTCFPWRDE
jgi:hypothetical protein